VVVAGGALVLTLAGGALLEAGEALVVVAQALLGRLRVTPAEAQRLTAKVSAAVRRD
jgi:hypothetical protein